MWLSADTHAGKKRSSNQDTVAAALLADCCYCIVCDGMGGENGGQIASAIAVETAEAQLSVGLHAGMSEIAIDRLLTCASAAANVAVFDVACADSALVGMGTTMIMAVIVDEMLHLVHAGDSRAYLLRDELLTQLTVDHTLVQTLLDRGEITEAQALNHPQRHYITRAVGAAESMQFDRLSIPLEPEDAVLICSDGLYNFIPPQALCALCSICVQQGSVAGLIAGANENGGGDNITAVLLCMGQKKGGVVRG